MTTPRPGASLNSSATNSPTLRVARERPAARRDALLDVLAASGGRARISFSFSVSFSGSSAALAAEALSCGSAS